MPIYRMLPPSEIVVAHFNPSKRIDRNRLTGLLLSIRAHGILEPLALARDMVLADGHRRLEAAKLLDLPEVPVAIYTEVALAAPALWVVLNSETMNLTPAQWLAAVHAGLPLETPGFPEPLKKRIQTLQRLLTPEQIDQMVEQGRSPLVLDAAIRISTYCSRRQDENFIKKAMAWLVESSNAVAARNAIVEEIPVDLLVSAIEENSGLRRVWDIAR